MNCEQVKAQFEDYLNRNQVDLPLTSGPLSPLGRGEPTTVWVGLNEVNAEVRQHLATCDSCRNELEILQSTWGRLGVLPDQEPSPRMRSRFYAALEAYQDELQSKPNNRQRVTFADWWEGWWPKRFGFQMAMALLLLVIGFGLGRWIPEKERGLQEVALLRDELKDMRELVTLSLLQQQSASERLKGVNWSYQISQPDEQVVAALFGTLNSDPNVNVRLAAVDALQQLAGHPGVRASLVHSLPLQESPNVQVALIDLLVELKERQSVEVLRRLVQDRRLHKTVRARAENGLKQIS
jgi:hypothetical protein